MRTIRTLLASAFILTAIVACEKKDPDNQIIRDEKLDITFNTASTDALWGADWENAWQYDWDESDST